MIFMLKKFVLPSRNLLDEVAIYSINPRKSVYATFTMTRENLGTEHFTFNAG